MPSKETLMRVTGKGELAFKLLDMSIESNGFIGSSVIIAHRPGISDDLVYNLMVRNEINRSAIIFPLTSPLTLPFNPQPTILNLRSENWIDKLQPGKVFRLHKTSDVSGVTALSKIRRALLPRKNHRFPIIFIIDTLQKISPKLDKELRFLIREAPLSKLSIWLHCPLSAIEHDLLSLVGNVVVIWPSKREFDILRENLSSDQIKINGIDYSRGMLFVSNFILDEGKGWQFSDIEYGKSETAPETEEL